MFLFHMIGQHEHVDTFKLYSIIIYFRFVSAIIRKMMEGSRVSVIAELNELVGKINSNPEHIQNEKNRVYQFNIEEIGPVQLLIKNGQVEVVEGTTNDPEVTLKLSEKNFSKLLRDDLNTTVAFMTGGLKVDGNIGLALKLQEILKRYK